MTIPNEDNLKYGWISLHRSILDNKDWNRGKFHPGMAWIDLLLLAQYEDGHFYQRNILINYKRGDVTIGVKGLAKRWKWSRNKTQMFLNRLETEHQIKQQKSKLITLISIVNYDFYQSPITQKDIKKDIKRTSKGHQKDTINKYNKENNSEYIAEIPEMSEVLDYCKSLEIYHPSLDFQIIAKYESWVENGWKDGYGKKIKNWKLKFKNTMPYFRKDFSIKKQFYTYNEMLRLMGKDGYKQSDFTMVGQDKWELRK